MTDDEFQQEIKHLLTILENLSQYPQFNKLCNAARETGEPTLEDAAKAVLWAVYYEAEPVYIPTIEEIFSC